MPQKGEQDTCRWLDYSYWPVKKAWHEAATYATHKQKKRNFRKNYHLTVRCEGQLMCLYVPPLAGLFSYPFSNQSILQKQSVSQ